VASNLGKELNSPKRISASGSSRSYHSVPLNLFVSHNKPLISVTQFRRRSWHTHPRGWPTPRKKHTPRGLLRKLAPWSPPLWCAALVEMRVKLDEHGAECWAGRDPSTTTMLVELRRRRLPSLASPGEHSPRRAPWVSSGAAVSAGANPSLPPYPHAPPRAPLPRRSDFFSLNHSPCPAHSPSSLLSAFFDQESLQSRDGLRLLESSRSLSGWLVISSVRDEAKRKALTGEISSRFQFKGLSGFPEKFESRAFTDRKAWFKKPTTLLVPTQSFWLWQPNS